MPNYKITLYYAPVTIGFGGWGVSTSFYSNSPTIAAALVLGREMWAAIRLAVSGDVALEAVRASDLAIRGDTEVTIISADDPERRGAVGQPPTSAGSAALFTLYTDPVATGQATVVQRGYLWIHGLPAPAVSGTVVSLGEAVSNQIIGTSIALQQHAIRALPNGPVTSLQPYTSGLGPKLTQRRIGRSFFGTLLSVRGRRRAASR